jgi:hypothetical protein
MNSSEGLGKAKQLQLERLEVVWEFGVGGALRGKR